MTAETLIHWLDALDNNTNPHTGECFSTNSCLQQTSIKSGIVQLRIATQAFIKQGQPEVLASELESLCTVLRSLEYRPTVDQLVRILRGSRSVADLSLRALPIFGQYRHQWTKAALKRQVKSIVTSTDFGLQSSAANTGSQAVSQRNQKREHPWQDEPFFQEAAFNRLEASQRSDLGEQVAALGLRKVAHQLPAFMQNARTNYPRAFEPWTDAERALLIEAMCYTNQAEVIAELFGRSSNSIRSEGKRLIYVSRQQRAVH